MSMSKYYIVILITGYFLLAACSSTRHLPEGEKLYTGARIDVNGTATVREKKVLQEDLGRLNKTKT